MATSMIEKLAGLGSDALSTRGDLAGVWEWIQMSADSKGQLYELLERKNGFYAFESSLHVFPASMNNSYGGQDLLRWNSHDLWKSRFDGSADGLFCFAEDIFGNQFCFEAEHIVRFDPETGRSRRLCGTLEEWANLICSDFEFHTGYPVSHKWQTAKGIIRPGNRLVPIYPFVTTLGSYEVGNLYEADALKGMLSRASFARQIRHLPDGTPIEIRPINVPARG